MKLTDTLRRAAGLLVELPAAAPETTSAGELNELLAELEGKPVAAAPVERETAPLPLPEGPVEFAAIYQSAGLPAVSFTAEQTLELLASLPPELPLETRRQTVRVSLDTLGRTLGATPETIAADAARKVAALRHYTEQLAAQTEAQLARAQEEIEALEAQILKKRGEMEAAQVRLAATTRHCRAEAERLAEVQAFFG